MLSSLRIRNYKPFTLLELPRLGPVNLFVGENNSGKSCLLEAVGLYAGRTPLQDILQTASQRTGEAVRPWEADSFNEEGTHLRHPIFSMFHHTSEMFDTAELEVAPFDGKNAFQMEYQLVERAADTQGILRYVPVEASLDLNRDAELAISVKRAGMQVTLITRRSLDVRYRISTPEKLSGEFATVAYLPSGGISDEKAASIWDELIQTNRQGLVLECLKFIEPKAENIFYVAGRRSTRVALLKLQDEQPVPLRSMGDGLTRMFHIALTMASSSGGVLLLDEFENGLHWKVQEQVWETICRATRFLSVQVFCSTHSRDTVEAFSSAVRRVGMEDASVYRLTRDYRLVSATELPLINVSAAVRTHAEIR